MIEEHIEKCIRRNLLDAKGMFSKKYPFLVVERINQNVGGNASEPVWEEAIWAERLFPRVMLKRSVEDYYGIWDMGME